MAVYTVTRSFIVDVHETWTIDTSLDLNDENLLTEEELDQLVRDNGTLVKTETYRVAPDEEQLSTWVNQDPDA